MCVVGVVVVVGVLEWDHDQDQLADLSSTFWSCLKIKVLFAFEMEIFMKEDPFVQFSILWKNMTFIPPLQ